MPRRGDGQLCVRRAVHQDGVAQIARHEVHGRRRIAERVVGRATTILKEQGNIVLARRQTEAAIGVVFDNKEAGHSTVDLRGGAPVGMRVVPVGAGAVGNSKAVLARAALRNDVGWIAVRLCGNGQAVPVNVRGFGQTVLKLQLEEFPAAGS